MFAFLIFDDLDELVPNLIEQQLGLRCVRDGKDHSTHVGAGPADVVHRFDMSDSFDDRGDLLLVLLIDAPIEFVSLFFNLEGSLFMRARQFCGA